MEEKLTIQPIRKSFINLRQMKSLTCLILPAVPTAPQIESHLSAIPRPMCSGLCPPLQPSLPVVPPHPLPSTPTTHCPPAPHMPQAHSSLRAFAHAMPLLRTHFPLIRLFQVLTPEVGCLGRPPLPPRLLCSMPSQHQVPQFLHTVYTSAAQRQQVANSVDGMKK